MSTVMLTHLELETGWLTSAASQIFFMQLGFLCFEVGYVDKMWAKSIIIKNIEDTFIGAITFIMIGYTLTTGATYYGIIGKLDNILLIGVDKSLFSSVFLYTCYGTTCATIISGAVLERMKNSAYMAYTFFVLLINYSLAKCWVWNEEGFLYKLGIIDCAGGFVVHAVGGMAGFVAVYNLGPRKGSLLSEQGDEYSDQDLNENERGKLAPPHPAKQPILLVIGTFILWYGWFSFNITSPLVANLDVGDKLAESGLNVFLAPCFSAATCWVYCKKIKSNASHKMVNFEDLIGCILSGLVAVTACCYTVEYWAACVIGILVVPVYFLSSYYIREKLYIDDPLCVGSVHMVPGFFGIFVEGIFADGTVKGHDAGLIYGGYKHFTYQTLAIVIGFISQLLLCIFIWKVILQGLMFRNESLDISTLDTYLGLGYFDPQTALKEMLLCRNSTEKKMLLEFKQLCDEHAQRYQLDFLVCISLLKKKFNLRNFKEIYKLYCTNNSIKNIEITQNAQDVIFKNLNGIVDGRNIDSYDVAYRYVFDGLHHFVKEFLQNFAQNKYQKIDKTVKLKDKYLPYLVDRSWNVQWMTDPVEIIISPQQEQKIQERRVKTSQHIARLSHNSYLHYKLHENDDEKSNNLDIKMEPIKEKKQKEKQHMVALSYDSHYKLHEPDNGKSNNLSTKMEPMQEKRKIKKKDRVKQKLNLHMARLSHNSYLEYKLKQNDHAKSDNVSIKMEPIKEKKKQKEKQTFNEETNLSTPLSQNHGNDDDPDELTPLSQNQRNDDKLNTQKFAFENNEIEKQNSTRL